MGDFYGGFCGFVNLPLEDVKPAKPYLGTLGFRVTLNRIPVKPLEFQKLVSREFLGLWRGGRDAWVVHRGM